MKNNSMSFMVVYIGLLNLILRLAFAVSLSPKAWVAGMAGFNGSGASSTGGVFGSNSGMGNMEAVSVKVLDNEGFAATAGIAGSMSKTNRAIRTTELMYARVALTSVINVLHRVLVKFLSWKVFMTCRLPQTWAASQISKLASINGLNGLGNSKSFLPAVLAA